MELNLIKRNETLEVQLEDETRIYILNQENLRDELNWCIAIDHKKLVLNLSGIRFIDTSGFKLLLELKQLYSNMGKGFVLSHVSKEVEELLVLVNVNKLFGREIAEEFIAYAAA
jgi:anti-anti-sigma factor